jgi:hypothetical protein
VCSPDLMFRCSRSVMVIDEDERKDKGGRRLMPTALLG